MVEKHIAEAAADRFPNNSLCREGFIVGVEWQMKQDAARGPRSVSGVSSASGSISGTHFTIEGKASDKIYELMGRDGAAWVRVSREGVHVFALSEVLIAPSDDAAGKPTPWRLSKCETMGEAKASVLPDQAGGIRVEWIDGKPCFIGFGDAHAINTLIASIRDQKMDVAKAALNSDCVTDGGVMRLLSSIENRLMEMHSHMKGMHNSQIVALDNWGNHLHDMIEPKDNEKGCPDTDPVTVDVDMAEKPSTAHYSICGKTGVHEVSEPVYRIVCDLIAEREKLSNDVKHLRRVASDRGKLLMRMNEEIDRIMD